MGMPRTNGSGGIAAVELVIVVSLVLLAIGLTVPILNDQIVAGARSRAIGDLRQLAADMLNYNKDTAAWPANSLFAYTDGTAALGESLNFGDDANAEHISNFLVLNKPPVQNWRGPYMTLSRPDPWGRRYVVILEGLRGAQTVCGWVLCAGPDGLFQTAKTDRELKGDDLGLLLR